MINTRFWVDDYTSNLDPSEKLLFLYFLTNPYTDICGIYEVPLKHIALETGLDREMVIKIIDRFSRDGKVFYEKGWVGIKNFAKHQLNNPKVKIGIENGLKQAPKEIIDRLSIDYEGLSHLNPNSNLNSNPNLKTAETSSALIVEIIKLFEEVNPAVKDYYNRPPQRKACENLINEYGFEAVSKVVAFLPRSNKIAYLPTITTPLQLWEKYQSLKDGLQKKKGELTVKGRGIEI